MTETVQPSVDKAPSGPSIAVAEAQAAVLRLEVAWGTHPGMARGYNEDTIQGTSLDQPPSPRGYLYLVADGMGGHNAGEVASAGAVQRIYEGYFADADPNVHRSLDRVIRLANAELYAQAQANPAQHGMGTTLTSVVIQGDRAYIAHVGDSRLYRARGGKPEQLTQDHSWVADQVRAGVLSPDQAEVHPQRNVITRALATAPDVRVDHTDLDLQVGDALILCSDGLSTKVGDNQIAALATKSATAQEAVQRLIKLANDNGGDDNISVAVIRVLGDGAPVLVAAAAEGVTEKVPVVAAGASMGGAPSRGRGRFPWILIGVVAAVLLIGGGIAGYLVLARRQPPTPTPAAAPGAATPAGPAVTSTLEPSAEPLAQEAIVTAEMPSETTGALSDTSAGAAAGEPTATLAPTSTAAPESSPAPTNRSETGPTQSPEPARDARLVAGPELGDPINGVTESGPSVRFSWTSDRPLKPGEAYALLVWRASDPEYAGCKGLDCPAAFDACSDSWDRPFWAIQDFEKGPGRAGPGDYLWTAVVVDTTRPDPADPTRCLVISDQPPAQRFGFAPPSGPQESTPAPL
jgi:serine/threonine protein phosphatase PrpC